MKNLLKNPVVYIFALLIGLMWGCGGSQTPYSPIVVGTTGTPAFALSVTPPSATITRGAAAKTTREPNGNAVTFQVTVTPSNGYAGTVNLSVQKPNGNFGAAFTNTSLQFTAANGTPQSSTLTVTLIDAAPADGNYDFVISAADGHVNQSQHVTVKLVTPASGSFDIGVAPPSQSMPNGGLATKVTRGGGQNPADTFAVNVTPTGGFTGTVNLSVTNPSPTVFSTFFDQTSLTFTNAIAQTSHLTITRIQATNTVGNVVFTVKGTSGATAKTATATIVLVPSTPTFTVTVAPHEVNTGPTAGSSTALYGVHVSPINGFAGVVTLSGNAPGTQINSYGFNPSTVTLDGVHSFDTVLTVTTNVGANGLIPFNVKGTSGATTATGTGIMLSNGEPSTDFTLTAVPALLTGNPTSQVQYTVTLRSTPTAQTFAGTITLSVAANTDPLVFTTAFDTPSVTLAAGQTKTAHLTINSNNAGTATYPFLIAATSGGISHTVEVDLQIGVLKRAIH